MAGSSKKSPQALVGKKKKAGMDRTRLQNIIRNKIILHEQIYDERVVHREELILTIADAIEAAQKK